MNAKPVYTEWDLIPRHTPGFSPDERRRALVRKKNWGSTAPIPPAAFDVPELVNPTAVAAIRRAFTQAKTSKDAWRSYRREGRFDARQAPRAARMEQDVFKTRTGKSTTRVKCSVLIDVSGSMRGSGSSSVEVDGRRVATTRQEAAAVFGATIAKALGAVPTIDLDVYQHAASSARLFIKWVWHRGTPVSVFNGAAQGSIGGGGNADGHALYAVADHMSRGLKRGEHAVILVVSDGMPSQYAPGGSGDAGSALIAAVAHARKRGITVLGVSIDGSNQSVYYGDGLVTFTGSWTALGAELGRAIGKELAIR